MANGKGLSVYENIDAGLEAKPFIPVCMLRGGATERQVNGLTRQYFPRPRRFDTITDRG